MSELGAAVYGYRDGRPSLIPAEQEVRRNKCVTECEREENTGKQETCGREKSAE